MQEANDLEKSQDKQNTNATSTPTLSTFDPTIIPYQYKVINDIRMSFNFSLGVHEILLSGSVGSAKSILLAHLAVTHCLLYPGARVCIGRESLPDLKDTIYRKILEHIADLKEGVHYTKTDTNAHIIFNNKSEIISRSWGDKRYEKARSLELSMFIIEEVTENDSKTFDAFYKEYRARVGRLPHIRENVVIGATNPDAPSHSAYDYFIAKGNNYRKYETTIGSIPTRHVYYSVTTDNPFLPAWYIEQLKETYTEKECRRMIYGEWIELETEVVYYAYDPTISNIESYQVRQDYPIALTFDFNIGIGKPMSCAFRQRIDGIFYYFAEIVLQGTRTEDILEEAHARGLFNYRTQYIIHGDATGKHNDTRSKGSDYTIIEKYLANMNINFKMDVGLSNPPIKERHNLVNGMLKNAKGQTHVKIVEKDCKMLVKGLKMTKLKETGLYIEDDGPNCPYQHITTAIGYDIVRELKNDRPNNSRMVKI